MNEDLLTTEELQRLHALLTKFLHTNAGNVAAVQTTRHLVSAIIRHHTNEPA